MPDVNAAAFEIGTTTRHGDVVRADAYLPKSVSGPVPVVRGASPYQKALRSLPIDGASALIGYGPMQLYLDDYRFGLAAGAFRLGNTLAHVWDLVFQAPALPPGSARTHHHAAGEFKMTGRVAPADRWLRSTYFPAIDDPLARAWQLL